MKATTRSSRFCGGGGAAAAAALLGATALILICVVVVAHDLSSGTAPTGTANTRTSATTTMTTAAAAAAAAAAAGEAQQQQPGNEDHYGAKELRRRRGRRHLGPSGGSLLPGLLLTCEGPAQGFLCAVVCSMWPRLCPLALYETCGDPVCHGWSDQNVPWCEPYEMMPGDICYSTQTQCDPVSSCNNLYVCATQDPQQHPGGCPVSFRHTKRDIQYLGEAERESVANQLLQIPLATWNYKTDPMETHKRLGFIIEDVIDGSGATAAEKEKDDDGGSSGSGGGDGNTSSPLLIPVDEMRGIVDLYSYISMAVATIQAQQAQLDRLQAQVDKLRMAAATSGGGDGQQSLAAAAAASSAEVEQ
jgi:hypothetical protein